MQAIPNQTTKQDVPCQMYFMKPDTEPALRIPEDRAALEQPFLSEAGETEESFAGNTSVWE